jgi:hypothetical protein
MQAKDWFLVFLEYVKIRNNMFAVHVLLHLTFLTQFIPLLQ